MDRMMINVHALIEYIPTNNEEMDIADEWQIAPFPGALGLPRTIQWGLVAKLCRGCAGKSMLL